MKNNTIHTVQILDLQRMKNSINGNPRFSVYMAEYSNGKFCGYLRAVTKPDDSLGYFIQNYLYNKELIQVRIGSHYGKQSIDLNI